MLVKYRVLARKSLPRGGKAMRRFAPLILSVVGLASCGQSAPHAYPATAQARFEQSCPAGSAVCRCTWDRITRTIPYEEYAEALSRFRNEGLMDPRVTRARTHCLDRHDS